MPYTLLWNRQFKFISANRTLRRELQLSTELSSYRAVTHSVGYGNDSTLRSLDHASWYSQVIKTNKLHTFFQIIYFSSRWQDMFDSKHILSATGHLISGMKKYCDLLVQTSWWWTIICSKHMEDNLIEINYWKKVCISLVFLIYENLLNNTA